MLWIWKFDPFGPMDVTPAQGRDKPDVIRSSGGGNNDDINTKKKWIPKTTKETSSSTSSVGSFYYYIQSKPQNKYLYILLYIIYISRLNIYICIQSIPAQIKYSFQSNRQNK